jgi:hypothetical protein
LRGEGLAYAVIVEPVDPDVDQVRLEARAGLADAFAGSRGRIMRFSPGRRLDTNGRHPFAGDRRRLDHRVRSTALNLGRTFGDHLVSFS